MENVEKHRDIKLVTTDIRKRQLASEPNGLLLKEVSETIQNETK